MPSKTKTVEEYLAALPADRREAIQTFRETIPSRRRIVAGRSAVRAF